MSQAHFTDYESLQPLQFLATPIWVFDIEDHTMWWANQAGIEFWNASSLEDLCARDFSTDSENVRSRLRQISHDEDGLGHVQDTWTLYPQGQARTVVLSFKPVLIERGKRALLLEVNRSIDVQADEDTIRVLEAVKMSALMVTTFSLEGRLLAQNPAALSCFGSSAQEVEYLTARVTDAAMSQRLLDAVMNDDNFDCEATVQTKHGERVHRIFGRRGRDPIDGAFVAVVSQEDVTEQIKLRNQLQNLNEQLEFEVAERTKKLRFSEERYELATRAAAIWDWQEEENRMYVSERFIEALGYDKDAFYRILTAETALGFIHPDDIETYKTEQTRHLKESPDRFEVEVRFLTVDGDAHWFHFSGVGLTDDKNRVVRSVGLMTDIHARKTLEASLFKAQRLEAVGQLTGGIAHDFNNLLTVIGGNAELLESDGEADRDLTRAIIEATSRGAKLTRHLLAFSRKQNLIPRAVALSTLIEDMSTTMLRSLGEEIDVIVDVPDGIWTVFADPTQIESALLNLALNARDAMPHGGRLTLSCENATASRFEDFEGLLPGDYVQIKVTDTGKGMGPETLARAFEPFFSTKGVGQGSGLGLSMVHGFSRQSGGEAKITSDLGSGTSVTIYLPRSEQAAPQKRLKGQTRLEKGQKELVFLLEDNPEVQRTLRNMLEALNYSVEYASTARAAYQHLKTIPQPKLYLLDVVLPGGESGVDFAENIRKQHPDAKIVFVSGYPQDELENAEPMAANHGFLQKPFSVRALSDLLGTIFDTR
ncbi:MAG: ATP-binding protein [Aliishimia sp.]